MGVKLRRVGPIRIPWELITFGGAARFRGCVLDGVFGVPGLTEVRWPW